MSEIVESIICPPHYWEVTSVRIDGVCHYHHHCVRCHAEKDVPLSATGSNKWVSRNPKVKPLPQVVPVVQVVQEIDPVRP